MESGMKYLPLLLLLSGCATGPYTYPTETVYVPSGVSTGTADTVLIKDIGSYTAIMSGGSTIFCKEIGSFVVCN
jgi:hypothetical protein